MAEGSHITFRSTKDIDGVIERHRVRINASLVGGVGRVTKSDVIRYLIVKGSEFIEAKEKDHGEGQD